jgi:hypothetical protein
VFTGKFSARARTFKRWFIQGVVGLSCAKNIQSLTFVKPFAADRLLESGAKAEMFSSVKSAMGCLIILSYLVLRVIKT